MMFESQMPKIMHTLGNTRLDPQLMICKRRAAFDAFVDIEKP